MTTSDATLKPGRPDLAAVIASGFGRAQTAILLLPAAFLLVVVFFYPVGRIVWLSFTQPHVGWENYTAIFTDSSSVDVLVRTVIAALIVSAVCLVLAFPYAYLMSVAGQRGRMVMLAVTVLPFWTSLIARNFAWLVLEERGGPISRVFQAIGIPNVNLLGTVPGVIVAMVQLLLPYMVLPLFSVMSGINGRVMHAAYVCGAHRVSAFRRVYLPLALPGVTAGVSLVFLLTLGFYVTPALLGSSNDSLIGQLIGFKIETTLDFAGAGAYSTLLIVVMLVLLGVLLRALRLSAAARRQEA